MPTTSLTLILTALTLPAVCACLGLLIALWRRRPGAAPAGPPWAALGGPHASGEPWPITPVSDPWPQAPAVTAAYPPEPVPLGAAVTAPLPPPDSVKTVVLARLERRRRIVRPVPLPAGQPGSPRDVELVFVTV